MINEIMLVPFLWQATEEERAKKRGKGGDVNSWMTRFVEGHLRMEETGLMTLKVGEREEPRLGE